MTNLSNRIPCPSRTGPKRNATGASKAPVYGLTGHSPHKDSRCVAWAATIEQLLLPSFHEPKENSNGTVNALAKRLQFRGSRSEKRRTRGVAHQHEYAAPCRLSCLMAERR